MEKNSWRNICKTYLLYMILAVHSNVIYAEEKVSNGIELSPVARFSSVKLSPGELRDILPIVSSEEEYFIASKSGKIHVLEHKYIAKPTSIDLKKELKEQGFISLTAIVPDPSFNNPESLRYHVFYTAHVELNKQNHSLEKINPIADAGVKINLPYDAVIMRWQYNKPLDGVNDIIAQHEVIRIAIHQTNEYIRQLNFDPYIKPWNGDYGLLYALLSKAKSVAVSKVPLYSGSILRIKPDPFDIQKYTIPDSNPFIEQPDIRKEIAFIADEDIVNFDWIKKSAYTLLVQSRKGELVPAKVGGNWSKKSPINQVKTTIPDSSDHNALFYYGKEFTELKEKAIQLQKNDNGWQLMALPLGTSKQPVQVASYYTLDTPQRKKAKFSIYRNNKHELLLFEHYKKILYAIKAPNITTTSSLVDTNLEVTEYSSDGITVIIVSTVSALLIGLFFYLFVFKRKKYNFLRRQWTSFDINVEAKSLSLYNRHFKKSTQTIELSSLKSSEIILNNDVISVISAKPEQGFSNSLEKQVLIYFAQEYRLKMCNNKERKIQIRLVDNKNKQYVICLYYRVNNVRHTRLQYDYVIKRIIDWNWFFAQYINKENTSKRKVKTPTKPKAKSFNSIPSFSEKIQKNKRLDNDETQERYKENKSNDRENSQVENKLLLALDKLIEMNKQGYLSASEFNIAKAKILKDLANE